nr:GNAT family N-acetyltransferase [Pseudomonas quercus]
MILNRFQYWRERGWDVIGAADYASAWARFGGSVATHPDVVERLAGLADIPVRYLGWQQGGELCAAVPVWGRHLALSKDVLKQRGKKGMFDLGNAEIILPAKPGTLAPLRHCGRYLGEPNTGRFSGLSMQAETLALAREPEALSKKFRYNQRRELRLLEDAGGQVRAVSEFSPAEFAALYCELFQRRWGFPATGADRMADVLTLLQTFMMGSVLFLNDAAIAIQLVYRVEAPEWVSVEYVNGGVDPQTRAFSPGSVLSYLNTQAAWEDARALGKDLRFSFGRADREYKARWCNATPVFKV